MCLITEQKTAKIAKRDLVGYKVVGEQISPRKFKSWIVDHRITYTLGKKYVTQMLPGDKSWMDCRVEQHYPNIEENLLDGKLISIGQGYHSAKTLNRLRGLYHYIIVKCTIPKGSEYYEDATGLRVSNQIILKEIVRQ